MEALLRNFLDDKVSEALIERAGPIPWPRRSPDLLNDTTEICERTGVPTSDTTVP
jgi:hypothetical protein